MILLGIIRRWHIRDQIPLREIARQLGISLATQFDAICALKSQSQPMQNDKQPGRSTNMHYSFQVGLKPKQVKVGSNDTA